MIYARSGNLALQATVSLLPSGVGHLQHTKIFVIWQGRLFGVASIHAQGVRVESPLNARRHGCWLLHLGCGDLLGCLQRSLIATILLGCGSLRCLGWGSISRRSHSMRWILRLFRDRCSDRRAWSDVDEGSLSRGIFIIYICPSLVHFYPYSILPLSHMFTSSCGAVN